MTNSSPTFLAAAAFALGLGFQTTCLAMPDYSKERVTFRSHEIELAGFLYLPSNLTVKVPGLTILGPVAFVKEQSPSQYATRMARAGFAVLIFDPRGHGESGGEPRRHESGAMKAEDVSAALDYLTSRPEVAADHLFALGVCQGVNWIVDAAQADKRIRAIALVAGHYLTPETASLYLGGAEAVAARISRSQAAPVRPADGSPVDYIPIVSLTDTEALLTAKPIYEWYIRWADRGPAWAFHGLWENRITRASEAGIWGHRVDHALLKLTTPTLMVHADRAASGPVIPRKLFDLIPAGRKELVWLGDQVQFQFYEEPETIDRATEHVAAWFRAAAKAGD